MRVLYLGIDPSRYPKDGIELIHLPLIETVPIETLPREVFDLWPKVTHVISTSPRAASHFLAFDLKIIDQQILCIGKASALKWQEKGYEPLVAKEATQEGVIDQLKTMDCSFVLYPKSSKARPHLTNFLKEAAIPHFTFDLYKTVFLNPSDFIYLETFDRIVFTSPSTVDAFFLHYKTIPKNVDVEWIGSITKFYFQKKMASNLFS